MGVSGDMPPLNMIGGDDRIVGMDVDLAAKIAQYMGVRLKLQKIDFSGLFCRRWNPAVST